MNQNNYENKNMPLTVGAARSLVRELFAGGDYVERKSIVEDILQHHTAKGGKDTPREKVTLAVKGVLRKFKAEGFAEKHPNSTGYWKIRKTQPLVSEESSEQTAPAPPFIQDESGRLEADLTDLAFEAKSLAACATALESKAEELAACATALESKAEELAACATALESKAEELAARIGKP